jgi:hypothetical protein
VLEAGLLTGSIMRQTAGLHHGNSSSEKATKLAQKLGQLKPFIAVFPQEYMGQLAYIWPI